MSRQRVLNILRGPEASRIRFKFSTGAGTLTIAPQTFLRVARAIDGGKVRVRIRKTFDPGVGAQYVQPNAIETPPVIGRGTEGLVLHECLHAFFDLDRTAISGLDEEAAAYVVSSLYFRMTGLPPPRWNAPLHALAGGVAAGLLRQYAAGKTPIPTVDLITWQILRVAIWADPVYRTRAAGTGGSYTHDG